LGTIGIGNAVVLQDSLNSPLYERSQDGIEKAQTFLFFGHCLPFTGVQSFDPDDNAGPPHSCGRQ